MKESMSPRYSVIKTWRDVAGFKDGRGDMSQGMQAAAKKLEKARKGLLSWSLQKENLPSADTLTLASETPTTDFLT